RSTQCDRESSEALSRGSNFGAALAERGEERAERGDAFVRRREASREGQQLVEARLGPLVGEPRRDLADPPFESPARGFELRRRPVRQRSRTLRSGHGSPRRCESPTFLPPVRQPSPSTWRPGNRSTPRTTPCRSPRLPTRSWP